MKDLNLGKKILLTSFNFREKMKSIEIPAKRFSIDCLIG